MKNKSFVAVMITAIAIALSSSAYAQSFAKISVKATDEKGQVISGAKVDLSDSETGARYSFKTDKKGEYFSIGIRPGKYKVVLSKDGKELFHFDNFPIRLTPDGSAVVLDFDLQKEKSGAASATPRLQVGGKGAPQRTQMTEEQKKELERINKENEKVAKENDQIKGLNQLLAQARTAEQAGNLDQAITLLNQATQAAPNRDLLWGSLGQAYLTAAKKAGKLIAALA